MIKLTYKSKSRIKTTEKQASPSVKPEPEPLVETVLSASKVSLAAAASAPNCESGPRPPLVIKLGIDVHQDRYVVVRQIDGGAPQPPQRFSPRQFLEWAKQQTALAQQFNNCYEPGPFGYGLHRKLKEWGITNYVIRLQDWDEYGKKVKTDKRDAKALVLDLDRYITGNPDAFCVVRVPTQAEEQARSRSRQRESLQKEKQRLAAQGCSHALYYGAHLEGDEHPGPRGSLRESGQSHLVSEGNQHPPRRHISFRRSEMGERYPPFLPPPLTVLFVSGSAGNTQIRESPKDGHH